MGHGAKERERGEDDKKERERESKRVKGEIGEVDSEILGHRGKIDS